MCSVLVVATNTEPGLRAVDSAVQSAADRGWRLTIVT